MKFWRVRSHHAEGGVEGAEFDLNPGSDTAPSPRAAGRRGAKLLSIQQDLKSWRSHPPDHPEYATLIPVQQSQEDDPPLSMLLKDYQNIPGIAKVDDVVKRLISLEMANKVSGLCQDLTSLCPPLETPSYPGSTPQPILLKSKCLSHCQAVPTCQYPRLSISRARTKGTACSSLYP